MNRHKGMHVCTHMCAHTHTHTHRHKNRHAYVPMHTQRETGTHTHSCTHTHACMGTYIYVCSHTQRRKGKGRKEKEYCWWESGEIGTPMQTLLSTFQPKGWLYLTPELHIPVKRTIIYTLLWSNTWPEPTPKRVYSGSHFESIEHHGRKSQQQHHEAVGTLHHSDRSVRQRSHCITAAGVLGSGHTASQWQECEAASHIPSSVRKKGNSSAQLTPSLLFSLRPPDHVTLWLTVYELPQECA